MPKTKEKKPRKQKQLATTEKKEVGFLAANFELTAISAKGRPGLKAEDYGNGILAMEGTRDSLKWGMADLMNELEEKFPEKASQYHPEFMDLSAVNRWRWVAARIPVADRRKELTFSHHNEVASIEEIEKINEYLDLAVEGKLGVVQLRKAVSEAGLKKVKKRPATSVEARVNDQPVPMEVVQKEEAEKPKYDPEPPTEVKELKQDTLPELSSSVNATTSDRLTISDMSQEDLKTLEAASAVMIALQTTDTSGFDDRRKTAWYRVLDRLDEQLDTFIQGLGLF